RSQRSPRFPYTTLFRSEYCDITFDESNFQAVDISAVLSKAINPQAFVDVAEEEDDDESFIVPVDDRSLEVMVLSNGVILGTEYLDRKSTRLNSSHVKIS